MPGEFIDEVHIFQCGSQADGGAIMCSEISKVRVPFMLPEGADPAAIGIRQAGSEDIHFPLGRLFSALKRAGFTEDDVRAAYRAAK